MKRLAVLLLLVASPVWGATYWVSPTGNAANSGADSTTNAKTLAWFNANAVAGDVCRFKSGTYSSPIQPANNGTSSNRIRYYGFPQDPSAVVVTDVRFGWNGSSSKGDYSTAAWVTVSGDMTGCDEVAAQYAVNDSLVRIIAPNSTNGVLFKTKRSVMDSCSISGVLITSGGQSHAFDMFNASNVYYTDNLVKHTTFSGTINVTGGPQGDVHVIGIAKSAYNRFYGNTVSFTVNACFGYLFMVEQYRSYHNHFQNNSFSFVVNATAGGTKGFFGMRDSTRYCRVWGNTMTTSGTGTMGMQWTNGGSFPGTVRQNYFGRNIVKFANTGFTIQNGLRGDTLEFNVIANQSGKALDDDGTSGQDLDTVLVRHNTFYGTANPLVDLGPMTASGSASKFVANLYYTTAANGSEGVVSVPTSSGILDSTGTVFSLGGTASAGFKYNGSTGTPGSGGNYGISGKAVWGSPRFVDSTYTTFDAGISETGYADNVKAASLHDGFSGVFSDSIGGSTGSSPPTAPGDSVVALVVTQKDDVAGVVFDYNADADTNAVLYVLYGVSAATDTAHAPARRPGSARTHATSLFGLTPSTTYHLSVVSSDGARKDTTFITRRENWWYREQTGPSVYVSPSGSDSNDGLSQGAAKRTISSARTVLLAQPNQGRGGAIVLMDGIHYQRSDISGSAGVPDTGYFIKALNPGSAIIDGADERIVNGTVNPTWGAVNAANDPGRVGGAFNTGDTLFATTFASVDSLEGLSEGGYTYFRCTSAAEVWNKSGSSGAGGYDLSATTVGFVYINAAADSIYVRTRGGQNIRTATKYFGYRPSLLYIDDPYWQVEGLVFRNAGGLASGNGIAVRFRAGDRANNGTVYNCTFTTNDREGVYAIGSGTGQADSIAVVGNTFTAGFTDRFGYDAGKGRREEARQLTTMDGAYNTIKNNTVRYSFNGIGHGGIAGDYASMSDLDINGNTVSNVSDDAIEAETDAGVNQRIVGNTLSRFGNGISHAPLEVGPYFVIKNLLLYPKAGGGAFKLGGGSNAQGFYYHNTVAVDTTRNSTSWYAAGGTVHNKLFVNNVLTGNGNRGVVGWQAVRNTLTHPDTAGTITNALNWNVVYAASDTIAMWRNTVYDTTGWKAIGFEKNGRMRFHPAWQDTATGNWTSIRGVDGGRRIAGITGVVTTVNGTRPDIGYREYVASVSVTRRQMPRARWWSPWAWLWWMVGR